MRFLSLPIVFGAVLFTSTAASPQIPQTPGSHVLISQCGLRQLNNIDESNFRVTPYRSALQAMLNDLIHEVVKLPIPWSVRVGLEARGISCGPMHLPPSRLSLRQMDHLRAWLESWAAERNLNLRNAWKSIPAQTGLAAYGGDR